MEHLSRELAERYRRRIMSKPELVAADHHLGACQQCRELLGNPADLTMRVDSLRADLDASLEEAHVDYPQLEGYVEQRLSGAQRAALDEHFRSCALCAEELRDLQDFQRELAKQGALGAPTATLEHSAARGVRRLQLGFLRPWPATTRWALAACALIALAIGMRLIWVWQHKPNSIVHQPEATPPQVPQTSKPPQVVHNPESFPAPAPGPGSKPEIVTHKAGTPAKKHDVYKPGEETYAASLPGIPDLPPRLEAIVAGVTIDRRLKLPEGFADLAVRRGANQDSSPLLQPVGIVVPSTIPVFVWNPVAGAEGYRVEVSDSLQNPIETSPVLTGTTWTSTTALKRGSAYVWRVVVIVRGEEARESALDVPLGAFRVLDDFQSREIQEVKRGHPQEHFTLGILLAHAGVLEEAAQEFRAVAPLDLHYELAKKFEREARDLIVRQRTGSAQ